MENIEFKNVVEKHILNYIHNNQDMDEEFFTEIINNYLYCYDLSNYLLEVNFINRAIDDSVMTFYQNQKLMNIYTHPLNQQIDNHLKYLGSKLNKYEYQILSYLLSIRALIHELTHVKQTYIANNDEQGIENELIRIESKLLHNVSMDTLINMKGNYHIFLLRLQVFLKKYYDSLLVERLAEDYAFKFVLSFLTEDMPNLREFYDECLIDNLFRGYEVEKGILIPPTYRSITKSHKLYGITTFDYPYISSDLNKTKEKVKKLSLSERFKLGLPISNEEFDSLF